MPVVLAACLIAPAIRTRDGSTPAVAVAFEVSTAMCWCPAPRETTVRPVRAPFLPKSRSCTFAASMVNGGLRVPIRHVVCWRRESHKFGGGNGASSANWRELTDSNWTSRHVQSAGSRLCARPGCPLLRDNEPTSSHRALACMVPSEQVSRTSVMSSSSERDAADRPKPSSNRVRTINLALQGGGAHGAFTLGRARPAAWRKKNWPSRGECDASAGARMRAAFAYGLAVDVS